MSYSPTAGATRQDLEEVLLTHALPSWRPYSPCWPSEAVQDHHLRGHSSCLVVGAWAAELVTRAPVVVDARREGFPLRLYASMVGHMELNNWLHSIGLFDPPAEALHITGTATFDPVRRTIRVCAEDLVVLHFRQGSAPSRVGLPSSAGRLPLQPTTDVLPHFSLGDPSSASAARERSPRRTAPLPGDAASRGAACPSPSACVERSLPRSVDKAPAPRLHEPLLSQPKGVGALEVFSSKWAPPPPPVVYQVSDDVPAQAFDAAVGSLEDHLEQAESEAGSTDPEDPWPPSDGPSEWRVPVTVLGVLPGTKFSGLPETSPSHPF